MSFFTYLRSRWAHLLELSLQHLSVVALSIAIATIVGVALGLATYQQRRARQAVLSVTGVFLTLPSLALFGLFIGWLGLGTLPVVVALVMYSLLPIVRNTVVGLLGVDPAIVESAQGMGMGRMTRLLRIELPLAWPVILTGMRVSTLLCVGIAAIGAYVRGPGLGNDIFTGLARIGSAVAVNIVLGGVVGIIVLAILLDAFYVLVNRLTTSRGIR